MAYAKISQIKLFYAAEHNAVYVATQAVLNIVLIHLLRSMASILPNKAKYNVELLCVRFEILPGVAHYRDELANAILACALQKASGISHFELAFLRNSD